MSQHQRIARNTLLAIVGVAGAGIVRFVFTTATGRVFGSAALGDVALIIAVATITTIPVAGIAAAGNRFLAVASGAGDQLLRKAILGATWRATVLSLAAASGLTALYLTIQNSASIDITAVGLSVAYVLGYGLYLTAKGVLFGDGKADRYALGELVGVAGFVVTIVLILSITQTPSWIILSLTIWALGVVGIAITASVGPTRFTGVAAQGMWPFAATATVGSLVSLGLTQATVLVMAGLHGSTEAGLLAAAIAITAPLYLLPRSLSLALTPSMSYHVGAGNDERANLDTSFTTSALVLFSGLAVAFLIGLGPVILSLFGSDFVDAMPQVALFSVASFLAIVGIPIVNRFASEGEGALRLAVFASAIGAGVAALVWLTLGREDPIWIAIGLAAASGVRTAIPFAMSHRIIGQRILPPFAISALAISGIGAAFFPRPWSYVALGMLVLATVPAMFVAIVRYRAGMMMLSKPDRRFTISVITNMYPTVRLSHYGIFVQTRVEAYRALGVDVHVVRPRRKSGVRKYLQLAAGAVLDLVRHPVPDIFEIHPTQPTGLIGWLVGWIAQRPYVLYAHGSDVISDTHPALYTALVEATVRHAREIHTNSHYTSDIVHQRWGVNVTVAVLPPGVRTDRPQGCGEQRDIDVLYVGNMIERKGVDILLSALRSMPDSRELHTVFAGDGDEFDTYRKIASYDGLAIAFMGAIPHEEIAALMCRAKVLAVPSREEALGQVAIESLAMGTPIVVSDVGGLSGIPDESCGTVVPVGDPVALRLGLVRWLELSAEERDRTTTAATNRAASFDVSAIASDALSRLRTIAEDPGLNHTAHPDQTHSESRDQR